MTPVKLNPAFRHWCVEGTVWLLSDLHFNSAEGWAEPSVILKNINEKLSPGDTFVCLGDVGAAAFVPEIRARRKVLILGNHDVKSDYEEAFDEIYDGPQMIADGLLLSHEPVPGMPSVFNVHGHCHSGLEELGEGCRHINLSANLIGYTPMQIQEIYALMEQGRKDDNA